MMALQDELKAVYEVITSTIRDLFSQGTKKFRYTRELFMGLGVCILLACSYVGYRWFVVSRDQTAQKVFSEYMHDYQLALKENKPEVWDRVASLFQFGHNQYRSSALAPYFLMMQSDVQNRQGKRTQAIETLSKAIAGLTGEMSYLLKIKRSLMKLDGADQAMRDMGLQELITLARDKSNPYTDFALFYLGRYYWAHDKIDEAQKTWQELTDASWVDKSNSSPWMQEAQASLKQIST